MPTLPEAGPGPSGPAPAIPGSQPQNTSTTVPAFWDSSQRVLDLVAVIAAPGTPQALADAAALWSEYRRLRGTPR